MPVRTYTVNNETYLGFNRNIRDAGLIGIVEFDGEPELWALDNSGPAVTELRRQYRDGYEREVEVRLFTNVATDLLAAEFGFKSAEKGLNWEATLARFLELTGPPSQSPHAKLSLLIDQMALDNNMPLRDEPEWPEESDAMEALAHALNETGVDEPERYRSGPYSNEIELLATGEDADVEALVKQKGLEKLSAFLSEVFDGNYSRLFFRL